MAPEGKGKEEHVLGQGEGKKRGKGGGEKKGDPGTKMSGLFSDSLGKGKPLPTSARPGVSCLFRCMGCSLCATLVPQ